MLKMSSAIKAFAIVALILFTYSSADDNDDKMPLWRNVTGAPWIRFKLDEAVSDEFDGQYLDENKWDPHGLRNENTGCPSWNGPTNEPKTQFATYFTTYTEPYTNGSRSIPLDKRQYRLQNGFLHLKISRKPPSYFLAREYFCNASTFTCNFDKNRPCYGTTFHGDPILKDPSDPTSYRYINHDKCKIEPYCIPHPSIVVGNQRLYNNFVAPNVVGRKSFRYGFFEVNVKTARTSAVSAVWMYDQNVFPSFARYIQNEPGGPILLENPSLIRSQRWQEIDMLEVMGTWNQNFWTSYIPNIHVFAMYKGEFTRPSNSKDGKQLGPIVLDNSVFKAGRNPKFNKSATKVPNSWHMNPGSVFNLKEPWRKSFHRVGLYWSENEIRFIVDGFEVLRVKNTIVHQRMFMVFSMSFNVYWAGVDPAWWETDQEFTIDYIRRWDVELDDDVRDPPSKLPLDYRMESSFESYGHKFGAVEGVFPIEDDNRSVELQSVEEMLSNGEKKRKSVWRKKAMPEDVTRMLMSEEETGRKPKVVGRDVVILESRDDRNREPSDHASYDPLNAVTVWDDGVDPLAAGAGWAT